MRITIAALSALAALASLHGAEARGVRFTRGHARVLVVPNAPAAANAEPRPDGGRSGPEAVQLSPDVVKADGPTPELGGAEQRQSSSEGPDIATGSIVPAEASRAEARPAARPWCSEGKVVGTGTGFCVLGLRPELRGAPALLPLSN